MSSSIISTFNADNENPDNGNVLFFPILILNDITWER